MDRPFEVLVAVRRPSRWWIYCYQGPWPHLPHLEILFPTGTPLNFVEYINQHCLKRHIGQPLTDDTATKIEAEVAELVRTTRASSELWYSLLDDKWLFDPAPQQPTRK